MKCDNYARSLTEQLWKWQKQIGSDLRVLCFLFSSNKRLKLVKHRKRQPRPLPESSNETLKLLLQSSSSSIAVLHLIRGFNFVSVVSGKILSFLWFCFWIWFWFWFGVFIHLFLVICVEACLSLLNLLRFGNPFIVPCLPYALIFVYFCFFVSCFFFFLLHKFCDNL